MKTVATKDLAAWLDNTLQVSQFRDYCPNGLQVEGKDQIAHIIAGVTASEALLQTAIDRKADAIMVHHGWFWKNEDPRVKGPKRRRLQLALQHDLNVFGFHLPLDAHPKWGNNAQLGEKLGLTPLRDENGTPKTCGPDNLVWLGTCKPNHSLQNLSDDIEAALGRKPLVIGDPTQRPAKIAWCTGGAQNFVEAAIEAGAQVYITGEASEQNYHLAHETGVAFIAAGHHATERYGIQALGKAVAQQFGIQVDFVDLDNPI
ncbi:MULTISPECIES: Nif3-like dinuclear metal center hexameric protein [unclassified Pusillimonas]|uniref:Nif3-like dinuclear metal center hexameric protein n=1 Tax=unclassified Pusillimonas TaxID=2640016 RepID=UPI000B9CD21F|nr:MULTISPECIES: Nif3-like dinuclear metal center hexameric protein [unclassified Pusillimonas]OXR48940.1 Nif3-like dinuclear metal center hexameric protein [Pusillimonas sp. T2]ROT45798.1 Nif3-like dinuclear metal center hexameric protein [Pusillimonas sp. NJUB218]